MELNQKEKRYLVRLVSADFHMMVRNMNHAACYGAEVVLPDGDTAMNILTKLEKGE